jgi:hypothetical protein
VPPRLRPETVLQGQFLHPALLMDQSHLLCKCPRKVSHPAGTVWFFVEVDPSYCEMLGGLSSVMELLQCAEGVVFAGAVSSLRSPETRKHGALLTTTPALVV